MEAYRYLQERIPYLPTRVRKSIPVIPIPLSVIPAQILSEPNTFAGAVEGGLVGYGLTYYYNMAARKNDDEATLPKWFGRGGVIFTSLVTGTSAGAVIGAHVEKPTSLIIEGASFVAATTIANYQNNKESRQFEVSKTGYDRFLHVIGSTLYTLAGPARSFLKSEHLMHSFVTRWNLRQEYRRNAEKNYETMRDTRDVKITVTASDLPAKKR